VCVCGVCVVCVWCVCGVCVVCVWCVCSVCVVCVWCGVCVYVCGVCVCVWCVCVCVWCVCVVFFINFYLQNVSLHGNTTCSSVHVIHCLSFCQFLAPHVEILCVWCVYLCVCVCVCVCVWYVCGVATSCDRSVIKLKNPSY